MTRPISNPWSILPILIMLLMFTLSLSFYMMHQNLMVIMEYPLLSPSPTLVSLTWVMDSMSLIFVSAITLISICVYNFSKGYMANEHHINRFSTLVLLFIISMYLLISIPNMITLLLGWDGLGLTSFLLIIYYQNSKSLGAGMFTFMSNRIGDALIIIAITLTLNMGQWNILLLWQDPYLPYLSLILMLGAITKSAQIPFSSWLPAAMAAPTPVSALVHSSTLVTAGIYLLIRFYPMLSSNLIAMKLLLYLSTLTTLMAGMAAMFETDMKKIIALSTLSQLGIMMMSLSLNSPTLAFFHLITHAMFKALLFISAGTLIHTYLNTQDLRLLGTIAPSMPLTSATMNTANIALCGLPFLSGFYSKDLIIELTMSESSNSWAFFLTLISTAMTAAYSMRFSYFTLWSPLSSNTLLMKTDNHNNLYTNPMLTMATASIITGAFMNWLFILPMHMNPVPYSLKLAPLFMTLGGIICAHPKALNWLTIPSNSPAHFPNTFMTMWFLTHLTTQGVARPMSKLNAHIIVSMDHGWNELIGPQGLSNILNPYIRQVSYTSLLSISNMILLFSTMMIIFSFMF